MASDLLLLEGMKSGVWSYFSFPAKGGKLVQPDNNKRVSVNCKLHGKVLKHAGNTTNLQFRLKNSHAAQFQALQQATKAKEGTASTRGARAAAGQQSIADAFQRVVPLPRSSTQWNQLTEAVCSFVVKDMQPLDTVNDAGFCKMIHEFEPRYTPPDRKTIATHYLP